MIEPDFNDLSDLSLLHYLRGGLHALRALSWSGPQQTAQWGQGRRVPLLVVGGFQVPNPRALPSLIRSRLQLYVGSRWINQNPFLMQRCFSKSSARARAVRGLFVDGTRGFASVPHPQNETRRRRRCAYNVHAWQNVLLVKKRQQQGLSICRGVLMGSRAHSEVSSPPLSLTFLYSEHTFVWMNASRCSLLTVSLGFSLIWRSSSRISSGSKAHGVCARRQHQIVGRKKWASINKKSIHLNY